MRTTVIPAQITTVEDKIAGNLNLVQIILLSVPIVWITILYAIFPARFHLTWYKFPLAIGLTIICILLALRIKGKVVASWLGVILAYNLRPKFYIYNKNESYLRDLYLPEVETKKFKLLSLLLKFKKKSVKKEIKVKAESFGIEELMKLKDLIHNPNYSVSLKPGAKGGLYVLLREVTGQSLK